MLIYWRKSSRTPPYSCYSGDLCTCSCNLGRIMHLYETFSNLVTSMLELVTGETTWENDLVWAIWTIWTIWERELKKRSEKCSKRAVRNLKNDLKRAPANRRNLARSSSKTIWNQPGICQNLSTTVWKNDMTEKSLQCKIPGSRAASRRHHGLWVTIYHSVEFESSA